jgi:hypothetical protein
VPTGPLTLGILAPAPRRVHPSHSVPSSAR